VFELCGRRPRREGLLDAQYDDHLSRLDKEEKNTSGVRPELLEAHFTITQTRWA